MTHFISRKRVTALYMYILILSALRNNIAYRHFSYPSMTKYIYLLKTMCETLNIQKMKDPNRV